MLNIIGLDWNQNMWAIFLEVTDVFGIDDALGLSRLGHDV